MMSLFSVHLHPRLQLRLHPRLLVAVLTALSQGFLLGWLHTAVREGFWPVTTPHWLMGLYAVSVFAPLTIQMLSEHWRSRVLWRFVAGLAALFFYFGWHFGADVVPEAPRRFFENRSGFVFALVLGVLWLHALPFLGARLASGGWRYGYPGLFATAWQQAIRLAEACLFTGLFWALLIVWGQLFDMLGYGFFEWLFSEPAFAYPFTALAFATALYLTGSLDRLVTVVREQVLGLLKWLAPLAALILVLFAPVLLLKLPVLVSDGERAVGAGWLLWLVAFMVLLVNAGFQDGRSDRPYPRAIGLFLRIALPATVVVAGTALYALAVRVHAHGLTVERVFGLIVALIALAYAVTYTAAALRRGGWLAGIARANVTIALGLIALLALTLTPIGSPHRLSAASQSERARLAQDAELRASALEYLRFDAGDYGERALRHLAWGAADGEAAAELQQHAQAVLELEHRYAARQSPAGAASLAELKIYPAGRDAEAQLLALAGKDHWLIAQQGAESGFEPAGLFIDLDGDTVEEFVVISRPFLTLYALREGTWRRVGETLPHTGTLHPAELSAALEGGDFSSVPTRWHDLRIGRHRLRMENAVSTLTVAPARVRTASVRPSGHPGRLPAP